ncbi:MAG: ABC transporter permease [Acidobacteria bacterium]|nr:ABC transporter permease [Acidobacteriota bacterium]
MTLDSIFQDLKFGVRQMVKQPGFAVAAITSLSLGIGANSAIFTLLDQVVVRMLPVADPASLVQLRVNGGRVGSNSGDGTHTFSYPTYLALRDQQSVFSGMTGQRLGPTSIQIGERPESVTFGLVDGNFFEVFGVRRHLGRLLRPDDTAAVAVLQYDYWRNTFEGRENIIGQAIRLNGTPFTVVGVAAPGFEGTTPGIPVKLWVPVMMRPAFTSNARMDDERFSWFYPFARLKPGVSLEQAQAAMRVLWKQRQEVELQNELFTRFPRLRERFLQQTFLLEPASQGDATLRGRLERPLVVLQWLVGAVLLIACSNVAGLLLARGATRQRELAIRGAIGAGRGRIVTQLLVESLLIATAGGAAGLALGAWLTKVLIRALPVDPAQISLSAAPDGRILLFTIALTAATALVFGLVPAWRNSAASPSMTLREQAGSIAHVRFRKAFVGLQVALSVILLLSAGLFVRSLQKLREIELGLKTQNVVAFAVSPSFPYDAERKRQLYRTLIESLARIPGVAAVGANQTALFTGGQSDGSITIPHIPENAEAASFFNWVTPGYFDALGIPVKLGRDFTWADWGSGRTVALVNERLVSEYFADRQAVGSRIGRGMRVTADVEVIGVFGNARYHDVRGDYPRQMFMNLDSMLPTLTSVNIYAKAQGDPSQIMAAMRREVARIDNNLVISTMRTMDDVVAGRLVNERLVSFLAAAFALLATLLAVVGLYGVLTFIVAQRTKEIGVRIALGAEYSRVMRLILWETAPVILAGIGAGAAASLALGRFVQGQLYGVAPGDPAVFAVAIAALVVASGLASFLPARRAAKIHPAVALRSE